MLVTRGIVNNIKKTEVPLQVPGLRCWFDPLAYTTFTFNSSKVSQWRDRAGEGRVIDQASSANQPLYGNLMNGKPVITFDGSHYLVSSVFPAIPQPNTIFIAFKYDSINPPVSYDYVFDSSNASNRQMLATNSGPVHQIFAGASVFGGTPTLAFNIHRMVFDGASSSLHINGASIMSGNASTQTLDGLTLGSRYSLTSSMYGKMGDFLVFDGLLDANYTSLIETWLSNRWGR